MEYYVISLLITGGVVAVILVIYGIVKAVKSRNPQPVLKADVRVVKSYEKLSGNSPEYYAEFNLKSGAVIKLKVKRKHFVNISEGDRGELKFKGGKFLNFKKDALR